MSDTPETNLARFADYAGFCLDLLAGGDGHRIENAPADFDGRVEAIRITGFGRFGNVFYQTLHAIALARLLGCHTVFASPLTMARADAAICVGGLQIVFRVEPDTEPPRVPTLAGHFFNVTPFPCTLRGLSPEAVTDIIQRYLVPMFDDVALPATPPGPHILVMYFRAGDIFHDENVHPFYVQPPASYYMRAVAFARTELGVREIVLVYEDDGNPAIARVRAHLESEAIPYAIQSGDIAEDLACLAGASHLVAPYSSFVEAAAMLSRELKTYISFRQFESNQWTHLRQTPLLLGVLRRKGVRTVLIDDAAGGYIPPLSWRRTPDQLRLIVEYGMENLSILEGDQADARELTQAVADAPRQVVAAQQEAGRLRERLLAVRAEAAASSRREQEARAEVASLRDLLDRDRQEAAEVQAQLRQAQTRLTATEQAFRHSTSWRITAPLRGLATWLRRFRMGGARPDRRP